VPQGRQEARQYRLDEIQIQNEQYPQCPRLGFGTWYYMKCLTPTETAAWLATFSVQRGSGNSLRFPVEMKKVMTTVAHDVATLRHMSFWLSEWWPESEKKLIVLTDWHFHTPDEGVIFEKIRNGCGEFRLFTDAPGHFFGGWSDECAEDKALFMGIIFHMIGCSWFGFAASESGKQFLCFGDEFIEFFSNDSEKLAEISELVAIFKLRQITDMKEGVARGFGTFVNMRETWG
jgi:hypothetical protein